MKKQKKLYQYDLFTGEAVVLQRKKKAKAAAREYKERQGSNVVEAPQATMASNCKTSFVGEKTNKKTVKKTQNLKFQNL